MRRALKLSRKNTGLTAVTSVAAPISFTCSNTHGRPSNSWKGGLSKISIETVGKAADLPVLVRSLAADPVPRDSQ